ncbi:MAG: hypothetical protein J4G05_03375 [Chlorobi bacterium]|nr:hypothetical protein [Chlorobiota bacterium]
MWDTFYHLVFYPLFLLAMRGASLWSPKIRSALMGRSDWRGPVSAIPSTPSDIVRIHFHATSVGEFEQAVPFIEALRNDEQPYRITVSFFSPSGFELRKNYPLVDGVCYLPHDRQSDMNEFMNRLSPDVVIIIRYDLWPEFVRQTQLRGIPAVLVCGVMRHDSVRFFPLVRSFFAALYSRLAFIASIESEDRDAFKKIAPEVPVFSLGDTRYDRVLTRLASGDAVQELEVLHSIAGQRTILIAGSTWSEDERMLVQTSLPDKLFLILVPHEPTPSHISGLLDKFPRSQTLSYLIEHRVEQLPNVVIVDRLGILAELYQMGDVAWVGGGFGAGVHSVLEPAAYGLPILCGPKIHRSRDAVSLEEEGVVKTVENQQTLQEYLGRLIDDRTYRRELSHKAEVFVKERAGATERILDELRSRAILPDYQRVISQSEEHHVNR